MRRNIKLIVFVSIIWMFVMVYYFQSSTEKVSLSRIFTGLSKLTELWGTLPDYHTDALSTDKFDNQYLIIIPYGILVFHTYLCSLSFSLRLGTILLSYIYLFDHEIRGNFVADPPFSGSDIPLPLPSESSLPSFSMMASQRSVAYATCIVIIGLLPHIACHQLDSPLFSLSTLTPHRLPRS